MNSSVADPEAQGPRGRLARIFLAGLSAAAFLLAVGVAPYALAAFASLGSGAAWNSAYAVLATLPLLLLALTLAAGRGAYGGNSRPASILALLVCADLASVACYWG